VHDVSRRLAPSCGPIGKDAATGPSLGSSQEDFSTPAVSEVEVARGGHLGGTPVSRAALDRMAMRGTHAGMIDWGAFLQYVESEHKNIVAGAPLLHTHANRHCGIWVGASAVYATPRARVSTELVRPCFSQVA
jgi:hypothetical protein